MNKPVEILKRKAARYARDSFEEHKEQIFGALQVIEQIACLYGEICSTFFSSVFGDVVEYNPLEKMLWSSVWLKRMRL